MDYSFFGTCSNDHNQIFGCLKTILNQSILPKELILVNSGEIDIEKKILNLIKNTDIKLVYIKAKLSRVKSLNIVGIGYNFSTILIKWLRIFSS